MATSPNTPARGAAFFATAAPVDGVVLAADSVAEPEGAAGVERDAADLVGAGAEAGEEERMLLAALTRVLALALALALSSLAVAAAVGVAIATHTHTSAHFPLPQTHTHTRAHLSQKIRKEKKKSHSPSPPSLTIVNAASPRLVAQHPR